MENILLVQCYTPQGIPIDAVTIEIRKDNLLLPLTPTHVNGALMYTITDYGQYTITAQKEGFLQNSLKIDITSLRSNYVAAIKLGTNIGSGGDYLSNEIFYRVSLIRTNTNLGFPTGHLHVPLIQFQSILSSHGQSTTIDFSKENTNELIEKIKELLTKCIQP